MITPQYNPKKTSVQNFKDAFEFGKKQAIKELKKKYYEKYNLVEVEWFDAQSGFSSPLTIEELEKEKPFHTYSVGYLLKQDDEKIIIGFMMCGNEESFKLFKHWQLIPKGMIKHINYLGRKKR
jgi:hypothetical protein